MRTVTIGPTQIDSSAIGLGCMGMSEFYGTPDDAESRRVLDRAMEIGVTHFDTSNIYGRGHNETLVGELLKGRRDRALISTKFGILRDPDGPPGSTYDRDLDNSPAHLRKAIEGSLKRLGTDHVDLYYLHRHDPNVPIEEVVGAMGELVAEGKVRGIGLSEVDADTLRRAAATHPVAALQSEYSLWERGAEAEVLPTCHALGITLVAYSPLGRGFLTGAIKAAGTLSEGDLRKSSPRFMDGNIDQNLALLEKIRELADRHGCSLGQVALAWIMCQSPAIVPIPGTKRQKYLEENVGAVDIRLTPADLAALSAIMDPDAIAGSRHWVPRGGTKEAPE
jgi:aryl-alcohol dehydrogenase-like predicted oxidoreductase